METLTFKRRELINTHLEVLFAIFSLISVLITGFFLLEDLQLAVISHPVPEDISLFTVLTNPFNILALGCWGILCVAFVYGFSKKLKPMFRVFFWISFAVLIIFFSWSVLISYIVSNKTWMPILLELEFSIISKIIILTIWCFSTIYFSFKYVTTKYLSIFGRLDYLFGSILRGNWDAFMFFRLHDPFIFIADDFNKVKDLFLLHLNKNDELLIRIKDRLSSEKYSAELKASLLEQIRQHAGHTLSLFDEQ